MAKKILWESGNPFSIAGQNRPVSSTDYYRSKVLLPPKAFDIKHPTNTIWQRNQILDLCKKKLSTGAIPLLEEMYHTSEYPFSRKMLARKLYSVRCEYLNSFKEYSDRRLIMLAERENFFDQWEGIYILGRFGGSQATKYLVKRSQSEQDPAIKIAISQALKRIKKNQARKKSERGF